MTTYDTITNAFNPALSDLARRMYAVLYDGTSKPNVGTYMAEWHIADSLGDRGMCNTSEWHWVMKELTDNFLVKELHDLGCRYELTSRAWRAHLLAEQAEKERAKEQAPATESPSALGNCQNCGIELDNVTTGMVVVHRENRHITVCGACADSLVARRLYTIVARAKSLSDGAIEGRR